MVRIFPNDDTHDGDHIDDIADDDGDSIDDKSLMMTMMMMMIIMITWEMQLLITTRSILAGGCIRQGRIERPLKKNKRENTRFPGQCVVG